MRFAFWTVLTIGCGPSTLPIDPFVGDWKLIPSRSKAIEVMKVQSVRDATYTFDFGGGSETIVVDGTDQPGNAGTLLSVTAEGPASWKVMRKKDGHVFLTALWQLSPDGNTLDDDYTEFAPDGQVTSHISYVFHRTANGAGFAGTWESPLAMDSFPPTVLQIRTYETTGLSFVAPAQEVIRNVKFDGKDYPLLVRGVASGATSSARRVGERDLEVTEKSQGQIRKTQTLELSPDHETLTQTAHPVGQREPNVFVFERQRARG